MKTFLSENMPKLIMLLTLILSKYTCITTSSLVIFTFQLIVTIRHRVHNSVLMPKSCLKSCSVCLLTLSDVMMLVYSVPALNRFRCDISYDCHISQNAACWGGEIFARKFASPSLLHVCSCRYLLTNLLTNIHHH